MSVRLVAIRTFNSSFDAQLAQTTLDRNGIPAFIDNMNDVIFAPSGGGYTLKVDEDYLQEALDVLDKVGQE